MNCKKCSKSIDKGEMYTVCEGKCANRFHATCVGVDKDQWNALANNIIWLCDCCMDDFCKYRDRQAPHVRDTTTAVRSVDEEISELKTKVATILETLATITIPTTPSTKKRDHCHSTPVTSAPCLRGGTNVDVCESDDQLSQIHPLGSNTFDLFLTNIDPLVTEHEISSLVCRCLGMNSTDSFEVIRLVSKRRDYTKLDYISFKLVLNENCRALAMNDRTWPKGVKFREFLNRHNETWKP